VLNAYIHSKLSRLLYKAGEELRERGYRGALLIGHNNGAVARVAKTRAINTYNSGPAAGLYGAREVGRLYGLDALISTDMGGTSFDIGYVRAGQCSYALRPEVEGFACNLPMMAIEALGAGGGSIARVEGGELKVGPQSAGAAPGPACFGLGGDKATVTDANLVLGILDADYFLGGGMKLNVEKAREAIRRDVAEPLGVGVEEAAWRIKREVERAMGRAVGGVVGRLGAGKDVPVVAYGGAGAIHAADIADEAGLNRVIITPFSAVSSAFGSSLMDVGHIYHRRIEPPPRKGAALDVATPLVEDMRAEARRDMRGEGLAVEQAKETLQLLWADESGREAITDAPMAALSDVKAGAEAWTDGRAALGAGAYLIGVSYAASASVPHFRWSETPPAKTKQPSPRRGVRQVYLGSDAGAAAVPVFDRGDFERDHKVAGPAIVESEQTTILVPNGWRFSVDKFNNANLERA
jgi:N-methylhydantoinase A/acetophenone carboxylase